MATCSVCDTRLFGAEIAAGVCENCVGKPVPERRLMSGPASGTRAEAPPGSGFGLVRTGVRLLFAGVGSVLLLVLVFLVLLLVPEFRLAMPVLILLILVMFLLGSFFCCAVPSRAGLGGLATASGLMLLLAWICVGVLLFGMLSSGLPFKAGFTSSAFSSGVFLAFLSAAAPLGLGAVLALFALLSALARWLREPGLADRLILYPVLSCFLSAGQFTLQMAILVNTRDERAAAGIVLATNLVLSVGTSVYLLVLLGELSAALAPSRITR